MSGEKILLVSDSLMGPTGFAINAQGVAWSLAKEYEVHALGLQSVNQQKVQLKMHGEVREVIQHPNLPRTENKWDFGFRSLPRLLDTLKPQILLTVNDIQMVQHIPNILYPAEIKMRMMDLPSKKLISDDALMMELQANIDRFKERYPLDVKWIMQGPQDGEPPMPQWKDIYCIADQVVAMTKYGQYVYKNYLNLDVPYIYHGIDTDMFIPKEKTMFKDKFVVGNINRNQPRKQPLRTMRAFARFAKDKPDVLLHMQMDWNDQFGWPIQYFGQMFGIMHKMIQPAPVGISREQVANIYPQWDLNVNTTGGEGFGITEIEGMSCGIPNVATDYTTSRELTLEGKPSPRGTCVPFIDLYWEKMDVAAVQRSMVDEKALAECYQMYYDHRDMIAEQGKNGREWTVNNCSLKNLQHKWVNLVKETLNKE